MVLYKRHSSGKIGSWRIWSEENTIFMETQTSPTAKRTVRTEVVKEGKALRTLEEQIASRINSRVNSKLDSGYKKSIVEAENESATTNTLDLPAPMLAASKIDTIIHNEDIYSQPKLDGMRVIITRQNNKVIAYSRRGKPVETIDHILQAADPLLDEGQFLDGELYEHRSTLQSIMSRAKRFQQSTLDLRFHLFDTISDKPFIDRFVDIVNRYVDIGMPGEIEIVKTSKLTDTTKLHTLLQNVRSKGYEGLILRNGEAPYEIGKRSKNLVKVKQFHDQEYAVVDVTTGSKGLPVLICSTGRSSFRVTAPGTHQEKTVALDHPELFVGKFLTVRHAGLTPKGIPFHPVAIGIRNER